MIHLQIFSNPQIRFKHWPKSYLRVSGFIDVEQVTELPLLKTALDFAVYEIIIVLMTFKFTIILGSVTKFLLHNDLNS